MAANPYKLFDTGFYKSDRIMPAHKCKLCIITMREIPEETGDKHFKVVSEKWADINGHEFRKDWMEDIKKGVKREIEIVYEKPDKFIFNKFYLLATRHMMWVWVLEPTED